MAVTGTFSPGTGVLTLIGDNNANNMTLSRNAAGQILANGGAVQILGGTPTVANTSLMQVFGLGGNDTITHQRNERRNAPRQSVRRRSATTS